MPVVIDNGVIYYVTDLKELTGTDPVVLAICTPPGVKYVINKIVIVNTDGSTHNVVFGQYNTTAKSWDKDKLRFSVTAGETIVLSENDLPKDYVITSKPGEAILAWAVKLLESATSPVYVKAEFVLL